MIPMERIERSIYLLRGQRMMLDRDLAELYGVETRVLNQAVRRNIRRFPDDFMITLTREEIRDLSQFVTSPGFKHAPNAFAFTEQGVAMLSSVLNSERAVEINIWIMRAFIKIREMAAASHELTRKLDELEHRVGTHDEAIRKLFAAIHQLMTPAAPVRRKIGFAQGEK